jgi:hypothetical protein
MTPTRGLMFDPSMNVLHEADDQPRTGILRMGAAVDVGSLSGAGNCFTAPTAADSQIDARGCVNTNWSCLPPSIRQSSSFGQR